MGVEIESRVLKDRQPGTMSLTTARVQCKADDISNKQFITYSVIITQACERVASSASAQMSPLSHVQRTRKKVKQARSQRNKLSPHSGEIIRDDQRGKPKNK